MWDPERTGRKRVHGVTPDVGTIKENLLWVQHFATVADLVEALRQFKRRYNEQWLIERRGYRTPAQVRRGDAGLASAVA